MRNQSLATIAALTFRSTLAAGLIASLGAAGPLGLSRALPPTTQRVHVPIPKTQESVLPPSGPQVNFRGRDYAQLTSQERGLWQAGNWRHESHNGHFGWWWVTGGVWYFYPEPSYPYPTSISAFTYALPKIVSQYWYYCVDPPGYYPGIKSCYEPWQLLPAVMPSDPVALGPSASAEVRAGYRIAHDICSACHVVHPNQTEPLVLPQQGPRFEEVANRPGTTLESLVNFISTTGFDVESRPITMPNQGLSQETTKEVAAYIISLRARK
jgi:mono/diheme cytochrome c family protein